MTDPRPAAGHAGGGPSPLQMAKIAFTLAGIATFGAGIRWENLWTRWAGIGLVAVAWILRFVKRPQLPDETR